MIAIKAGKIITLRDREIIEGKYLVVENGIIREIANYAPKGASVIDASKLWVLPSFIDPSTALGMAEEGAGFNYYDNDEPTNPFLPHLRSIDAFYPKDLGIQDAKRGGVSYFVSTPGNSAVFPGLEGIFKAKGDTADSMVERFPSAMKLVMNYNSRAKWRQEGKFPSTKMGLMALVREKFEKAKSYAKKKEKERDLEMEVLLDVLNQKIPLKVVVNTRDEIEKALELKKELGVHIILEQAEESFLLTKELKAEDVPVIVGPYFIAGRMYHQRYHYVKYAFKLYEDGVLFALTTDHPTVPVHFLYPMSVLFVKAGMPELDALRLISTNPAKILGMDKETGTIEVGKRANLVFLSDEPYTLRSEVVGHMIEGEMVWKNF